MVVVDGVKAATGVIPFPDRSLNPFVPNIEHLHAEGHKWCFRS